MRKWWCLWLLFFCVSGWVKPAHNTLQPGDTDRQALASLADVLENPVQRKILIAELRKLSTTNSAVSAQKQVQSAEMPLVQTDSASSGTTAQSDNTGQSGDKNTNNILPENAVQAETEAIKAVTENAKEAVATAAALPKKVAEYGAGIALRVGGKMKESWEALVDVFTGQDTLLRSLNPQVFLHSARNLSIVILSALCGYYLLRLLLRRIKYRIQRWVQRGNDNNRLTRRLFGIIVVSLLDGIALAVAYVLVNVVARYAVGEGGLLSLQGAFFIRAFLILEVLKIGIRLLFYPGYDGLRLIPCDEKKARYWNGWFATLINLLGYGYLVAYKLIFINLSPTLALVFSAVLALSAFICGINMVIRQRENVRAALISWADKTTGPLVSTFLRIIAVIWHWLALLYFLMLLSLTMLSGENSLPFVLRGTLNTLLLIGGEILVSALLTQYIRYRIRLPAELGRKLAGVEQRLNFYVPNLLRVIRFVLFWAVLFAILNAWNIIDMRAWLNSAAGQAFMNKWFGVLVIVVFTAAVWLFIVGVIEHKLSPDTGSGKPGARVHTLLTLLKSGLGIVLFSVSAIMMMSEIGINIGPLIAGAGVLGLAVGFGAQKLVQDIITGIFFQIENAMNAGDIVTVDGITGTAEHISIRSVCIRDLSGTYHLIPFSNVTRVSNYMRGYANHLAEYGIAYRENIDEAIAQLKAAFDELAKSEMKRHILEPISIHGVTQLADSAVMIRISIKTTPGDQWRVGRAYNRLVKLYFDAAGIEIPYPHTQIYFGEDKQGNAPPLHVRAAFEEKANYHDVSGDAKDR